MSKSSAPLFGGAIIGAGAPENPTSDRFETTLSYTFRFFRVKCGKKLATGTCVFYYEFKSLLIVPDMVLETPMYALLTQWFDTYTRRVRNSGQGHPTGWETQPLRMPVKA